MSDFLIYAARMQDAGVSSLWVNLGSDKERTRLMHVSPDASTPRELAERFPTRTFELCGTDRVLERLKDDMLYSGGPTPEQLQAAIDAHPLQADDLREWFADWLLMGGMPTDEELDAVEVSEAEANRSEQRAKDMLRGFDIARQRDAMQQEGTDMKDPAQRDAWWAAQVEALRADAERYRWLRNCLWNQERNGFTGERSWLWSTRFASGYEQSGELDCLTQGQELDAAIDVRLAEEAYAARTKEQT